MTNNFTSLCDKNFIHYAQALLHSMRQFDDNFTMHFLCLDKQTQEVMSKEPNVVVTTLTEIQEQPRYAKLYTKAFYDPSFEAVNVAKHKNLAPHHLDIMWALASYFTNHILTEKNVDQVSYLDSDLYFFKPWQDLISAAQQKSISIVRNNAGDLNNGEFNVSFISFKNDLAGTRALFSWSDWVINKDNPYYKTHGHCGDQAYLDLFKPVFGEENVQVLDDMGILQTAPWSLNLLKEKPTFHHFSDFRPDYKNGSYLPAPRHGLKSKNDLNDLDNVGLDCYDRYYEITKGFWEKLNANQNKRL